MNRKFFTCSRLVSCLTVMLLASDFSGQILAQTQIVNCDAPVQSRKRGIGVNNPFSPADMQALAPGVSWFYDWGVNNWTVPSGVAMSYIPMAWNGSSGFQTSLTSYLAAGNRPWRVFALNEPNYTPQANMTPSNSAVAFKQVKAICDPYNIPVICPHMAEGTAANQSITAYDPIQGSNVTYTTMEPFLKAFFSYCSSNTPAAPAGISDHSYAGYGDLTYWTGLMHSDFPTQTVWVTEFNTSASSDAAALANLIPSVDYCERTPWIEGYSWFMSRISGDPYNSLLNGSGVLTPAGQAYVQMPVHQTNLYYHIPGRLQAERYVTETNMNIAPTTDTNGLADMVSAASAASVDYNIQVDTAGTYPLSFRVAGTVGQIRIYTNGTLAGQVPSAPTTGWNTVSTTAVVPLVAGTQTLHVVLLSSGQHLNWMDFLATNGTPSVPDNLSAAASGTQVVLNWSASSGATNYNIKSATSSGGPYTTIASTAATTYTNTGLITGVTYYYVVSAVNASGESSNSIQVSVTNTAPPVNLALNKPVTVSSTQSGYPGSNAVDGNTATRWSSASSDPQWIYVDLLTNYNISEVDLYWEAAYATSFQIQVSPDAANWTTIYNTTSGIGGTQYLTGLSGTGRYVRMYGTARGTIYGYSLWEFQVFGTLPAPTNQPPVLTPIPDQSILAGQTLLVTNSATDPNVPPLPLSFSLLNPPLGATIDTNSGVFSWRPTIAQSPSTQTVAVVVSDNSMPPLSATQSFTATVIQPVNPTLNSASMSNGQFGFWINGNSGPDYAIQVSTNLTIWTSIVTNSSPTLPFFWTDTNSASNPLQFYRVILGP